MKRKYIYSFCAMMAASVILPSCKKEYLDVTPTDQVSNTVIGENTTNAGYAMNAIYRAMYSQYSNQDEGGESSVMIDMDFLGEDLVSPTTSNGWFINLYKYITTRTPTQSQVRFVYRYYYTLIANANTIISVIDGATGPDAEKATIKAEALAMRAYAHFKLVQLFGERYAAGSPNTQLGVPINIKPIVEKLPRATVAAVYTQINTDLDQAITLFGTGRARSNKSHININVARGIKARVALTMQDYPTAAALAAQARAGFTLMSKAQYTAGFNNLDGNPEWIWGISQIADQTSYFYSFFAYMSVNFNSTNIRSGPKLINSALYNQISATDIRKTLWDPTGADATYPVPPSGSRFPYMNRKFLANSASNSFGDVPFMRASEMYLIEAEALARSGNNAGAQDALFTIAKQRDESYVKSTKIGTALIDEIMIQRRVELWGEGFRFTDLKRLNLPLNRNGANHVASVAAIFDIPAGDQKWQWVFPQDELNVNNLIVQNPL
jgi:hypothetical protein